MIKNKILKRLFFPNSCHVKTGIPKVDLKIKINDKNLSLKFVLFEHRVPQTTNFFLNQIKNNPKYNKISFLENGLVGFLNNNNNKSINHEHYDEFEEEGLVGLINENNDLATSSFFISLLPMNNLNYKNIKLGKIIDGLDELKNLNYSDKIEFLEIKEVEKNPIKLEMK